MISVIQNHTILKDMDKSKLFHFLDKTNNYSWQYFYGPPILTQLEAIHELNKPALNFYRETILNLIHLNYFLKPQENLGNFIDSENPYFRFKLEMNENGQIRTLLFPEKFDIFPESINGIFRLIKLFPGLRPYSSNITMENTPAHELGNLILKESYQAHAEIFCNLTLSTSLMLTKLPPQNVNLIQEMSQEIEFSDYIDQNQKRIGQLLNQDFKADSEFFNYLKIEKFDFLNSKEIVFHCSCSKEKMISNLLTLHHQDLNEVFADSPHIEITCDYCNKNYNITKEDCYLLK